MSLARHLSFLPLTLLPLLVAAPLQAQEARRRPEEGAARMEYVLHGLEQGVEALKAIGRDEEATHLNGIADGIRERLRLLQERQRARREGARDEARPRENAERRAAAEQIEMLRHGVRILAETGHPDAAEILEQMVRARRFRLDGRRDREAMEVYRSQPEPGAQVEVLQLASRLWAERGHETKAAALQEMAEQTARRLRSRERGGEAERRRAEEQLEVLRMAMPALREGERRDLAEALEHVIHARELALEGRTDPEAMEIRRRVPGVEDQVEILATAARLWRRFGDEEKSQVLARAAESMRAGLERREEAARRRARPDREARPERPELEARVRRLEEQVRRLGQALERMQAEGRRRGERLPGPTAAPPQPPVPDRRAPISIRLF